MIGTPTTALTLTDDALTLDDGTLATEDGRRLGTDDGDGADARLASDDAAETNGLTEDGRLETLGTEDTAELIDDTASALGDADTDSDTDDETEDNKLDKLLTPATEVDTLVETLDETLLDTPELPATDDTEALGALDEDEGEDEDVLDVTTDARLDATAWTELANDELLLDELDTEDALTAMLGATLAALDTDELLELLTEVTAGDT